MMLAATAAMATPKAYLLDLDGAVGPVSAGHIVRGLKLAAEDDASIVVLRIDTPGGLDSSMREIVRAILSSPVPVVGYVAPSGARAASAGTYILYACQIAAMAPGTNLGAATPVSLFGDFSSPRPKSQDDGATDKGEPDPPARRRGGQGHQRRRRLYPRPRPAARAQRRLGRDGDARGGQPAL